MSEDNEENSSSYKPRKKLYFSSNRSLQDENYTSGENMTDDKFSAYRFLTENDREKMFALQKDYNIDSQVSLNRLSNDSLSRKSTISDSILSMIKNPTSSLSKHLAALYIVISVSGNGVIYLPYALRMADFRGMFLLLLCGINSFYCTLLIGWCRMMIQEHWPQFKENNPSPYPEIGYKIYGKLMKYIVTIVMDLSITIYSIILVCYMARMIDEATPENTNFCFWIIILILILIPLTWIGELQDLWFIVIIDGVLVVLFSVMVITAIFIDKEKIGSVDYPEGFEFYSFATSFGIITYILTGGPTYPSIHDSMENRRLFTQSAVLAYSALFIIYLPVPLIGFAAYGIHTAPNILYNLKSGLGMRKFLIFLQIFFAFKLIGSLLVALIPLFRNLESLSNCPPEFGYKRCLLRSTIMIIILFIGMLIQQHLHTLQVLGTTLLNFLTYLFPVMFYVSLVMQGTSKNRKKKITKKEWLLLIEIVIVSLLGSFAVICTIFITDRPQKVMKNCYTSFFDSYNGTCIFC